MNGSLLTMPDFFFGLPLTQWVAALLLTTGIVGGILVLLRRRQLREKYAALWISIGMAMVVITLYPPLLIGAADLVGVEVPVNLLFILTFVLLLGVCLHLSVECTALEEETRTLAESVALLQHDLDSLRTELRRELQASDSAEDLRTDAPGSAGPPEQRSRDV